MRGDGQRCNAIVTDAHRLLAMWGDDARWLVIQDNAQR
jgi:hypothetical protein